MSRFRAPPVLLTLLAVAMAVAWAANADALRLVDYSLEDYPLNGVGSINDSLRMVIAPLQPTLISIEEIETQAAVDSFRAMLNRINPGEWASAPYVHGNDENNAFFYRTTKWRLLGNWAFYPDGSTHYRLCDVYRMKPVGYTSPAAELRFFVMHFQSGQTTANNAARVVQTGGVRDSMNHAPSGTHAILVGDFNMLSNNASQGFQKLVESQSNNRGRTIDLLNPTNQPQVWDDNGAYAFMHTLSPCKTPGIDCPSGYGGGGLDERFDFFMPTYNLNDGQGMELLTATYAVVGNDGQHLLKNITDTPVIPEGRPYANLLQHSSEHLPIRIDLQVFAKLAAPPSLALGTVIVGGGGSLAVSNPAETPADALSYSLSASSGFSAPSGAFELAAGAAAAQHAVVAAATGSFGPRSGSLTITSDDPDHLTQSVSLSATVLDHAQASLDGTTVQTAASVDFGDHPADGFSDQTVNVYDRGYGSSRARLSLTGAEVAGGAGRFSVPGFAAALVAGSPQLESIHFDATGATLDSTYTAQLRFHSDDEPLPGATSQPDLVVSLRARVLHGSVGVDTGAPSVTRLYPPIPNPLVGGSTLRFELAQRGSVSLEILDLSGRCVARLVEGDREAGVHSVRWSGDDARGRHVSPGVYFVRLVDPARTVRSVRLAVVR